MSMEETPLITIPKSKLSSMISKIESSDLESKIQYKKLFQIYYESNIPVDYWNKSVSKDNEILMNIYNDYSKDLKSSFIDGRSMILSGKNGVGKTTLLTFILKTAIKQDYTCFYTNLFDIVSVLTTAPNQDRFNSKQILVKSDFLVIDEFDDRFILSNSASDLYISILETVLRTRLQNKLPIFLSTNSPNILKSINGTLQTSLESLFNKIEQHSIFGADLRIKNAK